MKAEDIHAGRLIVQVGVARCFSLPITFSLHDSTG